MKTYVSLTTMKCQPDWLTCIGCASIKELVVIIVLGAFVFGMGGVKADMSPKNHAAMIEWERQRDDKVLKQKQPNSCGAASLANLMTFFYNQPVDETQLLDSIGQTGTKTLTMLDIVQMAKKADLALTGYRAPSASLLTLGKPAIVRIQEESYMPNVNALPAVAASKTARETYQHFVVLVKVDGGNAFLKDPANGNRKILFERFVRMWEDKPGEGKGALLVVAP